MTPSSLDGTTRGEERVAAAPGSGYGVAGGGAPGDAGHRPGRPDGLFGHDRRWATDAALTRAVTRRGQLLLYDDFAGRMQVTHIAFDPYNRNRIFIGTKDAGVIVSEDRGATWEAVAGSEALLYISGVFVFRDNRVAVSTYGRGLWTIDFGARLEPFDPERHGVRPGTIRRPGDAEPLPGPIDWGRMDVTIFSDGRVNGLALGPDDTVMGITVTPGTVATRYLAGEPSRPPVVAENASSDVRGALGGLVQASPGCLRHPA